MASSDFFQGFEGSPFKVVSDQAKGHHSDFAPSTMRRQNGSSYLSPVAPKKKLHLSRWDASPSSNSPVNPMKRSALPADMPPVLKRLVSPPPKYTLQDVLKKPVRRPSFENRLGSICCVNSSKGMSTADLLSSVLSDLNLTEDDSSLESPFDDELMLSSCPVL
jgi:hypothetical protein